MLSCAFLPLFKGGLKDLGSTDSWRAVAGSSVILKLLDNTILNVWGHLLVNDSLAFRYKNRTSTTECSWLVMEVAEYYRRHGSPPKPAHLMLPRASTAVPGKLSFAASLITSYCGGLCPPLCLHAADCLGGLGPNSPLLNFLQPHKQHSTRFCDFSVGLVCLLPGASRQAPLLGNWLSPARWHL